MLKGWRKLSRFESGLGEKLPEAYKKFWHEWKIQEPAAVHYVKRDEMFERNEKTGLVSPVQNVKIPLLRLPEEHLGLWGGEAIIKGFQKRNPYKRRVPHFWVPTLKRSVVKSEILNEFFSLTVTDRTIQLILDHHGFDHYLLKTPACDLRSQLALKLKQRMLKDIQAGFPAWTDNKQKLKEMLAEYRKYAEQFTPEEVEWYGLSWDEAIKKIKLVVEAEEPIVPLKIVFRNKLIEQLRAAGIQEAQDMVSDGSAK